MITNLYSVDLILFYPIAFFVLFPITHNLIIYFKLGKLRRFQLSDMFAFRFSFTSC